MAIWRGETIPDWYERLDVTEVIEYRSPFGEIIHRTERPSPLQAFRIWPENPNLRRIVQLGEKFP